MDVIGFGWRFPCSFGEVHDENQWEMFGGRYPNKNHSLSARGLTPPTINWLNPVVRQAVAVKFRVRNLVLQAGGCADVLADDSHCHYLDVQLR